MNLRPATPGSVRRRRRSAGLTLLEALTTLAVLAILATVALPATGERIERTRLQAVAELLVADLANARIEAAQSGQPLHLAVTGGPDWCWSVSPVAGCGCGESRSCQLRRVSSAEYPGFTLSEAQGLELGPTEVATRTPIAALESRHGERLKVELSALGRPRLCLAASRTPAAWRTPRC